MNFNTNYSDIQQKQVQLINDELQATGMQNVELGCGFELNAIKTVLSGNAPINPQKVIDALWKMMFNDADPAQMQTGEGYTANYTKDDIQLCNRIRLRLHDPKLREQGVNSASLAASLNRSASTVSQLINGKYSAKPTKYLHDIWALVAPVELTPASQQDEQAKEQPQTEQPPLNIVYGSVPFIQTSTSTLIDIACEQAKQRRRFAVFAGAAGIGKTKGILEYCRKDPSALLVSGSEQTTSTQVLEQLCLLLGLSRSGSSYKNMNKIIATLRESGRVIILDEADKCKPNALDPLRTISDQAVVGVTLVGNIQLVDKLQTQDRYELIASRVCFWPKPVGQITLDDIRTLFLTLTAGRLTLASDDDKWWLWLHKRVDGNARELVENLLPHLLLHTARKPQTKVDKLLVNGIFSSVLNKPAV